MKGLWDNAAVRETFALVMHRWLLSARAEEELADENQEVISSNVSCPPSVTLTILAARNGLWST